MTGLEGFLGIYGRQRGNFRGSFMFTGWLDSGHHAAGLGIIMGIGWTLDNFALACQCTWVQRGNLFPLSPVWAWAAGPGRAGSS
jgi:hypothetical protein